MRTIVFFFDLFRHSREEPAPAKAWGGNPYVYGVVL